MSKKMSFIILGGGELPWIYPLGTALSQHGFTSIIRLGAVSSIGRRKIEWPFEEVPDHFERLAWTYPPGFNGKLSIIFKWFIRKRLNRLIQQHKKISGEFPFIITPYPNFFSYIKDIDPNRIAYLNYDLLDMPEEDALVNYANIIFCSSHHQACRFSDRYGDKKDNIFHLPHGVNTHFIDPEPMRAAHPNTVCAVGYLSNRYDWVMIHEVVARLPHVQFLFVGDIDKTVQGLDAVLKLSNVSHIAGLLHRETSNYFWQSAVNWMPYKVELKFVQACCPLKLMDGLASGRPVISADVPECRLYPKWVGIYKTADEAVDLLLSALSEGKPTTRRVQQMQFALNYTWAVRAEKIVAVVSKGF